MRRSLSGVGVCQEWVFVRRDSHHHMVDERAIHILLEYFLVCYVFAIFSK